MSATPPVPDSAAPYKPRQRERRLGFAELVASLTRLLDKPANTSMMRGAFEEMVRRIVPVPHGALARGIGAMEWPQGSGRRLRVHCARNTRIGKGTSCDSRSDAASRMPAWRLGLPDARHGQAHWSTGARD